MWLSVEDGACGAGPLPVSGSLESRALTVINGASAVDGGHLSQRVESSTDRVHQTVLADTCGGQELGLRQAEVPTSRRLAATVAVHMCCSSDFRRSGIH